VKISFLSNGQCLIEGKKAVFSSLGVIRWSFLWKHRFFEKRVDCRRKRSYTKAEYLSARLSWLIFSPPSLLQDTRHVLGKRIITKEEARVFWRRAI